MAATRKWSDNHGVTEQVTSTGRSVFSAELVYQVTEAPTSADAVAQIPFVKGSDHPEYGPLLRVNLIDPQQRGPAGYWEVRVGFSSETGAGGTTNTNPRIRWTRRVVTEEVDRNFEGYPITNSVGDPPVNRPTRDFRDLILTYSRWEDRFDMKNSQKYIDSICSDSFNIAFGGGPFNGSGAGGMLTVFGGECQCTGWEPVGDYEEDQALVLMGYEFTFRARIIVGDNVWMSGFDWRFLDQGSRGIYDDNGTERLGEWYLKSDEPATELVRLTGRATPIRREIKVTKGMKEPIAKGSPAGAEFDLRYENSDPGAVFLIYKKYPRQPFKGLLPLFK